MQSNWNSLSFLMGIQNGAITLGNSLEVSLKDGNRAGCLAQWLRNHWDTNMLCQSAWVQVLALPLIPALYWCILWEAVGDGSSTWFLAIHVRDADCATSAELPSWRAPDAGERIREQMKGLLLLISLRQIKLKIYLSHNPAIPLLSEMQTYIQTNRGKDIKKGCTNLQQ